MAVVVVAANFGPRGLEVPTISYHPPKRWPLLGDAVTVATAVDRYRRDTGLAPESLEALVVRPKVMLGGCGLGIAPEARVGRPLSLLGWIGWNGPYVQEVPLDPWGNPYVLEAGSDQRCWLRCLGADGAIGGADEEAHDYEVLLCPSSVQRLRGWVRANTERR